MSFDPTSSASRSLVLFVFSTAVFCAVPETLWGQTEATVESVSAVPLNPASSAGSGPLFEKLTSASSGVDFSLPIDLKHPMKRLYHPGAACGGVGIGDFDGDDRADIFFAGGPVGNRLYRQVDDFKFADVTAAAGINVAGPWGSGTAMADIDNDGDLDIYVCNYDAPNLLYLNQSTVGNLKFVEAAERFGLALVDASQTATFADYDRDGDLDAFVLTNRFIREGGLPEKQPVKIGKGSAQLLPGFEKFYKLDWVTPTRFQIGQVGRRDRLLRNDGGRFVDVSIAAGITEPGEGLSATWWDYNSDGWLDLYVGNDFQDPDHLYRNNSDGSFTDVIDSTVPHTSWYSMGADAADLNNDGLMDFLTADMSATSHFKQKTTMGAMGKFRDFLENSRPRQYMRNALYLNSGTGRFMDAAYLTGMADTDWTWSVKLADFDNDGWVDSYFTNGMSRSFNDSDRSRSVQDRIGKTEWDLYEDAPPRIEQNLAFRNRGGLRFEDASKAWGLDHTGMSLASAYADLDRDGDLDLVTMNFDEPVSIYRNHSAGGRGILVRLAGTKSNRHGIGTRLVLESGGQKQVRCANPSTGFKSTNGELIHFGIGDQKVPDRLWVHWPSGHIQSVEAPSAGQLYTITEPSGPVPPRKPVREPTPMFLRGEGLAGASHKEKRFDDFKQQPLLPNKLSQLGPGMAWGDADGDGDDDLYLCGAAEVRGQLWINFGGGKFRASEGWSFDIADDCEEMGAIFFDADSDGDEDLYVVSGGVENRADSDAYRDRLYLNDGKAYFSDAPGALPAARDSGSVVSAADFDRDGDLDLFVGGRVTPGAYPMPAQSRLLINESADGRAKFSDATDEIAKGLHWAGLVTGALWSDADGDGWTDLLVTREWGTVMLFRNVEGAGKGRRLEASELPSGIGWWNGIAGRDLDNDGDIDYVVTNFGLNTKYHASPKNPALLYYGDFDKSGRKRLIEAEFEDGTLFPIRGKSCSSSAIPGLGAKYKTYHSFAAATLEEIYTAETLAGSLRLAADNLQSGVLVNNGKAGFAFKPLPQLAQIAPSFGVVLSDFDGDGNCDIVLAQNFFSPQLETGRMDGGLGLLLLGDGAANFQAVWPDKSGIVIEGDGKSLTVADIDQDSWPDFVVGINDDRPVAMVNQKHRASKMLRVRLEGEAGNLGAVGARVTLTRADGTKQSVEVTAGSGYLSQSASSLFFGLGETGGKGARIGVLWPDGSSTVVKQIPAGGGDLVVRFQSRDSK